MVKEKYTVPEIRTIINNLASAHPEMAIFTDFGVGLRF